MDSVDNSVVHRRLEKESVGLDSINNPDGIIEVSSINGSTYCNSSRMSAGDQRSGCCAGPRASYGRFHDDVKEVIDEVIDAAKGLPVKTWIVKTASLQTLKNKLPIMKWLPQYRWVA